MARTRRPRARTRQRFIIPGIIIEDDLMAHPRGDPIAVSTRNALWEAAMRAKGIDPKALGMPEPEFKTDELKRNPQDKPQK